MRAGSARVDCAPKIAAEVVSHHSEGTAPVAATENGAEPPSAKAVSAKAGFAKFVPAKAVSARSVSGPGTYPVRAGASGVPDTESAAGTAGCVCAGEEFIRRSGV